MTGFHWLISAQSVMAGNFNSFYFVELHHCSTRPELGMKILKSMQAMIQNSTTFRGVLILYDVKLSTDHIGAPTL